VFSNLFAKYSIFIILLYFMFVDNVSVSYANDGQQTTETNTIEIMVPFYIPSLDLRGYDLNFFEVEQWFLDEINSHRDTPLRTLRTCNGYCN